MKNFICINGQKIELPDDVAAKILAAEKSHGSQLADFSVAYTVEIAGHEMIVLEHFDDGSTLLQRKDALRTMAFGKDNNYDGSDADRVCNEFAEEIADVVGEENIIEYEVDLTANDGLKDYGTVWRKAFLRTADMQRKYVEILDKYKLDDWEWLATAYSAPTHGIDRLVLCVTPAGHVDFNLCGNDGNGVRPFCILKSNIFVSK